jgi:hypothetical protein
LEQLFLDASLRAGLEDDVRMIRERVAERRTLPPEPGLTGHHPVCATKIVSARELD